MVSARSVPIVLVLSLLSACASVPRDAGFADVRRTILEETRQPVEWEPSRPVLPPDDAAVAALLEDELTPDRAVQVAFANNRDVQATLEELGVARAELIAASTIRNPLAHAEVRFPADPILPFELGLTQSLLDLIRDGLNLPRVATAANDEVIGEPAVGFIKFQQGDIGRLFGFASGDRPGNLPLKVDFLHSSSARLARALRPPTTRRCAGLGAGSARPA